VNAEFWKKYLYTAGTKLNELTTDQIATCTKILALELGKHRFEHGDLPDKKYVNFIIMEDISDEAKGVFIKEVEWY